MNAKQTIFFKVLGENREPCHGGSGQWPEPGIWTEEQEVRPCRSGWHLCRSRDLLRWLGPCLWLAEAEDVTEAEDKVVAKRARLIRQLPWDNTTARLWAADCAESALPHWEGKHPDDSRPRKAIAAARAYAKGEITPRKLAAAHNAASNAAQSAASNAAYNAAKSAAQSAVHAAYGAAYGAACSAACSAADDAAYSVAKRAMVKNLLETYLGLKAGW